MVGYDGKRKKILFCRGVNKNPTEQQPRQASMINNSNEEAAERKTVSILCSALASAGTRNLKDNLPIMVATSAKWEQIQ